jgi:ArsR family transcriptional regulator
MSNYRNYDIRQLSAMFKALSNPNRLKIFMRLISCCSPGTACDIETGMRACVGDLGKDLGIVPSTISHHIKELSQAGLIKMQRKGQRIECWVDPEVLGVISEFFAQPAQFLSDKV